jgi:ferredoxin-NADP reductase
MPLFQTTLAGREMIARGTSAFRLARPEGFAFAAGQAVNLTLLDPPETDAKGNSRTFSIASAPSEPTLQIATRMRDTAFKRVLGSLASGAPLKIRGPMGKFVLPDDASRPVVLLAGGIGITPFMSMLREEERRDSRRPRVLLYSNRTPADAPFLGELEAMAARIARFRLVSAMTEAVAASGTWGGIADPDFIAREVPDARGAIHYLAGPPAMVASLRQALAATGVPEADVRTDEFYGY